MRVFKFVALTIFAIGFGAGTGAALAAPANTDPAAKPTSTAPAKTSAVAAAKPAAGEKGLVIKQHFGNAGNAFTTYITPTGVRVDRNDKLYSVISHAPDWKVYFARHTTKETASLDFIQWCKYPIHAMSWTATLKRPISAEKTTQDGHSAIKYHFGSTEVLGPLFVARTRGLDKKDPNANARNWAEIVCLDFPGADRTGPVVSRIRGLPPLPGIVYSCTRFSSPGTSITALLTDGVQWDQAVPASKFVLPAGYKTIPFDAKMLETAAINENTESLLKDFMSQ